MSFYVDTQLEALQIAFSLVKRKDIAEAKSIEDMAKFPGVEMVREAITNILDTEGKHAQEAIFFTLEVDDWQNPGKKRKTKIGSAPFRSGFDIWFVDPDTGIGVRWN